MSRLLFPSTRSILVGWSVSRLHGVRGFHRPSNLCVSGAPNTLLYELFPEEAEAVELHKLESGRTRSTTKSSRHIPRLPLTTDPGEMVGDPGEQLTPRSQNIRNRNSKVGSEEPPIAVLFLRHAPKTLTEDDFRRIIPKGRHIPSWKLKGDILKVIPIRDPKTLTHLGHYYLLFSSMASAGAYRAHASRLHRLSKAYTPDASTSPLPPPPAYLVDDISGEDVHALLRDYALIPPSQDMHLMFVKYPYPRPVQQLIDNGGYGRLGTWSRNLTNMVLFSTNGAQPSTNRVRIAISQDGKDRSLHWGINNILKVDGRIANFTYGTWDEDLLLGQARLVRRVAASASGRVTQLGKSIPTPWLVTLKDAPEAKRFVRAWNQRAFPMANDLASDGPPSMVKAELVW